MKAAKYKTNVSATTSCSEPAPPPNTNTNTNAIHLKKDKFKGIPMKRFYHINVELIIVCTNLRRNP